MKSKFVLGLAVVTGLSLFAGERAVAAEEGASKEMTAPKTVQGEVLDMNCYMDHGAKGEKHKDCAAMCVKDGAPMGLLTTDGKVYLLVENHSKKEAYDSLKNMAAEQVKVTGSERSRGGITAVSVDSVTKS